MTSIIILASGSERRRALLESCRIPYRVMMPTVSESLTQELLARGRLAVVKDLALRKAVAARRMLPEAEVKDAWILGADTLVEADGAILGKPRTRGEARDMLGRLSGRVHQVSTALALLPDSDAPACVDVATTAVEFRALDGAEVDWYVGTGEWRGVAGGYRIQERGAFLVSRIDGSYSNVVGLPLDVFYGMLVRHQYRFP